MQKAIMANRLCKICLKSYPKGNGFGRVCSNECQKKLSDLPKRCKPFCIEENMIIEPVIFSNNTTHHKKLCKICRNGQIISTKKNKLSIKEKTIEIQQKIRINKYGDNFYTTKKWLSLRYDFIVNSKKECNLCGSTKKPFHIDHIKPRSKHPELELDPNNLQILCADCNYGKGCKTQQ